jgi:hypothetical protein
MTETVEAPSNGAVPAPAPAPDAEPDLNLPEGAIRLPPALVAVLVRLMQGDQRVQDVLYAYTQGLGRSEPLALVLPVVLLLRPNQGA